MRKVVLDVALVLVLLPVIGSAALYEGKKIATVEEAKEKVLKRVQSYSDTPNQACYPYGQYMFKDEVIDYPPEECLKDAGAFFTQIKNEKEASAQEKIKQEEDAKQKKAADLSEKQAEEQAREADIKSGNKKPTSIKENLAFYKATDGMLLTESPKIKPDSSFYAVTGKIDTANNEDDSFIAKLYTSVAVIDAMPRYFSVKIPAELKESYYATAKLNTPFVMIGKYVDNQQYNTVTEQLKLMPVFSAVFFQIIN